ncbi:MAG: hypothetical protein H9533_20995 [Rhodobacteraceae bacterium]|nr:hypothetical protein [Paracoccaceae bacterium]
MTAALASPARQGPDLRRLWTDAPALATLSLILILGLIPLYAAMSLDLREFQGESPWLKPVKFHYALAIYAVSLAVFARYMPAATRQGRAWRWFIGAVVFAIIAECVWLWGAASVNTASHFNTDHPVFSAIYTLMGAFAVLLTSASLVMGISIWRNRATGLHPAVQLSIALGLILTFALTVPAAGYLSAADGHFVGTPVTGAALPILGWSREVGDLRVAHFLSTHALHGLPLWGLIAARMGDARGSVTLVWGGAALYVILVAATFIQALNGLPLF